MSKDEQLIAMGRALSEYSEVKKKLAALYSQIDRVGNALDAIGWYLTPKDTFRSSNSLRNGAPAPDLSEFPTAQSLAELIADTLATQKRKKELQATLKEFGAEPRD